MKVFDKNKTCKKQTGIKIFFLIGLFAFVLGLQTVCARQLTLRLLIWDGYAPSEVRDSFARIVREKYGVDLNFKIILASNPDDFFDMLRSGEVDMISPAHNLPKDSRFNLTTNGLTLPVNLENVPNYTKLLPELYRQPWAMEQDKVFGIPIVHGIYGLAYNTQKLKVPPESWNVFWDPEHRGRYTVNKDYYELNIYISALALGYDKHEIFHYDAIKGPVLEKKILQLAKNSDFFWQGFDKPEQYKDLCLATTWRFVFPKDDAHFKPWQIALPKEGTPWWIDTLMISHTLKDQPLMKKIAEDWINYLLEPSIQANSIARHLGTCPVTSEAFDIYMQQILSSTERKKLKRLFQNLIPWKILDTRDRNAFKLLWTEALEEKVK